MDAYIAGFVGVSRVALRQVLKKFFFVLMTGGKLMTDVIFNTWNFRKFGLNFQRISNRIKIFPQLLFFLNESNSSCFIYVVFMSYCFDILCLLQSPGLTTCA